MIKIYSIQKNICNKLNYYVALFSEYRKLVAYCKKMEKNCLMLRMVDF